MIKRVKIEIGNVRNYLKALTNVIQKTGRLVLTKGATYTRKL